MTRAVVPSCVIPCSSAITLPEKWRAECHLDPACSTSAVEAQIAAGPASKSTVTSPHSHLYGQDELSITGLTNTLTYNRQFKSVLSIYTFLTRTPYKVQGLEIKPGVTVAENSFREETRPNRRSSSSTYQHKITLFNERSIQADGTW